MRRFARPVLVTLVLASALLAPSALAQPCVQGAYTITELVGLGGPVTQAEDIAGDGDVAGWSLDGSWVSHAVVWRNGQVTNLSSATSAASGISSNGRVAGWSSGRRGTSAALWEPPALLRSPRGSVGSQASDVNDAAVAVGWSTNSIGDTAATRWDGTRAVSLVSGPGAPSISLAIAINEAGTIVGRGDFASAPFRRALKWSGTAMTVLSGLGSGYESAAAISSNGLITGAGLSPVDSKFHAVVWNGSSVSDLGLFGASPTAGYGINACGTVVGDAVVNVAEDITEAVIWPAGGSALALESLLPAGHGWDLRTASALNDTGQIVGHGYRTGLSGLRSFLMTPS